jgi:hypothetical protein
MLREDRQFTQAHQARYTYQRGEWRATCESCGWTVIGNDRRDVRSEYWSQHEKGFLEPADDDFDRLDDLPFHPDAADPAD